MLVHTCTQLDIGANILYRLKELLLICVMCRHLGYYIIVAIDRHTYLVMTLVRCIMCTHSVPCGATLVRT